jgi:hypothetical protein
LISLPISQGGSEMQTCRTNRGFSATGGSRRPLPDKDTERQTHACHDNRRPLAYAPGRSRICLHVLTGRVDAPKVCTRQFECYHCGFDQLLDEMDAAGMTKAFALAPLSGGN